jgi:hypothetical protein
MGDYTNMAAYYDAIMTSGYYDYRAIVDDLPADPALRTALEIECIRSRLPKVWRLQHVGEPVGSTAHDPDFEHHRRLIADHGRLRRGDSHARKPGRCLQVPARRARAPTGCHAPTCDEVR